MFNSTTPARELVDVHPHQARILSEGRLTLHLSTLSIFSVLIVSASPDFFPPLLVRAPDWPHFLSDCLAGAWVWSFKSFLHSEGKQPTHRQLQNQVRMAHACGHLLSSLQPPSLVGTSAVEIRPKTELKSCWSASSSPSFSLGASFQPESKRATTTLVMMSFVTQGRLGGGQGGAGVLERPGLDQSTPDSAPRTEEGGEMGKSRQSVRFGGGDRYRVLLLDHERHTESHVAKVIPRVVPKVTPDEAKQCFYESREFGFGLVTIAVREHAEFYVQMLVRNGLRSTIEQDGTVA